MKQAVSSTCPPTMRRSSTLASSVRARPARPCAHASRRAPTDSCPRGRPPLARGPRRTRWSGAGARHAACALGARRARARPSSAGQVLVLGSRHSIELAARRSGEASKDPGAATSCRHEHDCLVSPHVGCGLIRARVGRARVGRGRDGRGREGRGRDGRGRDGRGRDGRGREVVARCREHTRVLSLCS